MNKIFHITGWMIVGLLAFTSCSEEKSSQTADKIPECHQESVHEHAATPAGIPSGSSLFNLSSEWTDQFGNDITLASLKGDVAVISMVYTSCQYACPRIVSDMLKIEEQLDEQQRQETKFVLVSFDSEHDTPEKLYNYAKKLELNSDKWILLHGNDANIMELAMVLGIKYKKSGTMDYSHSNIISLLNPQGEIIYQQEGLDNAPDEALTVLNN